MSVLLDVRDLRIEGRLPNGKWAPIVDGVSFEVDHGEVVGLIGESGAGKSTIALASLAYTRPGCRFAGGSVVFDGTNILDLSLEDKRKLRGHRMGYIAQSAMAAFNPALSIVSQVTEGPLLHRLKTHPEAVNYMKVLSQRMRLPDLSVGRPRYAHQFSGGQLQRFMAVMAMSCAPRFVVFDEPTTAIDVTTQVEVLRAFRELAEQSGTAAIYVTHDLAVVSQMADRIVVLRKGHVVETGPIGAIISKPSEDYTKRLMAAVRPAPRSSPSNADLSDIDELSRPVIAVKNLDAGYNAGSRSSRATKVLHNVSFSVPRGRTVGVIGESGCGKSTLVRAIAGLLSTYEGRILLNDCELAKGIGGRSKYVLQRIQLVTQNPDVSFNPKVKVSEVLQRPLQFYFAMDQKSRRDRALELLRMVGLPDEYMGRYPQELSGGEKQRLSLARALAAKPDVVLCDEVTSALDTIVGAEIIELLRHLQATLDTAFVFISHDLSTVASFADRIVVLYAGRIVEEGPTARVLSPPYHPYTRLLLDSVPEMRPGWLEARQTPAQLGERANGVTGTIEPGCPFHERCPKVLTQICDRRIPPVHCVDRSHRIACHRALPELT